MAGPKAMSTQSTAAIYVRHLHNTAVVDYALAMRSRTGRNAAMAKLCLEFAHAVKNKNLASAVKLHRFIVLSQCGDVYNSTRGKERTKFKPTARLKFSQHLAYRKRQRTMELVFGKLDI